MPTRQISPSESQTQTAPTPITTTATKSVSSKLFPPLIASTAAFSIFLFLVVLYRKLTRRKRTTPADSDSAQPPHRFSYSVLRRATNSFADRLGQGGFGPVFSGSLKSLPIAVKVMDSGSLQGEREFHNELFFASKLQSPYLVSVLGFSSHRKRRRMLLVYELMPNGNLQDALLKTKRAELLEWRRRYDVVIDIAKGLEYLHSLDPPVIHGDIKPSNILLDQFFKAKIGDFGLARVKSESQNQCEITVVDDGGGLEVKKDGNGVEDCGSVVEETESVTTFEDFGGPVVGQSPSPESVLRVENSVTSPETVEAVNTVVSPEGNLDGKGKRNGKGIKSVSGRRDWWWKQENGEAEIKKDYVMEWIGTEIKKERPKSDWIGASSSSSGAVVKLEKNKKKNKKSLEWWVSMDEEKNAKNSKTSKRRQAREWWKEEYCEELARKNKKKGKISKHMDDNGNGNGDNWWPRDEDLYPERKKKRSRSQNSRGSSIDWWLDGLSGELWRARRNSHDSGSGGVSSTPSMRGTVCYIAPEYGGGADISEKCDVYSYGVLLLVVIAGRRPLQVTNTPISEYQRANLLSWARQLARTGKLLDLVDKSVESLDREQALLSITVALLCLQKRPARRPSMKQVVGMLTGELEPPQLPIELSPSTPSRFPYKSHKNVR